MALRTDGILTTEELCILKGFPSAERLAQGPVVVIECSQEIPCNPCEAACPQGAIRIGEPIITVPELLQAQCTGCGICIAHCPGQAIFVVDLTYSPTEATVQLPFEFLPLPRRGDRVRGLDRAGRDVCAATVHRVLVNKHLDRTPIVTVVVPREFGMEVRAIRLQEAG